MARPGPEGCPLSDDREDRLAELPRHVGELEDVVATLKAEPGKDIIVDGGPALVHDFIRKGLADDYRIGVWPVILGRGNHYWGPMLSQQTLKLVDVKQLTFGRLFLHYEAVR
ncbi:MAG: dihydrofolate reductase family protein [Nitrososphaerota archaeon]|nr:dihydrofolate reductase family protein [Nitrososphaerota archaeon]